MNEGSVHGQSGRRDVELHEMRPGDYGRSPKDGNWYCRTPSGLGGNLTRHEVTEHENGTITVSPSILVQAPGRSSGPTEWHGYLERGEWREC
jgi:hypothetical protein